MNFNRLTFRLGILLFLITIGLFLGLYFVFSTNGSISEADYFSYSSFINYFLLTFLYAATGFYSIYSASKIKALTFREGFKQSFLPQFIGGITSLILIFVFFNTVGSWAEDSYQRGWHELKHATLTVDSTPEQIQEVEAMKDLGTNVFSLQYFYVTFSSILLFYVMISTIFAIFLKNRKL